MTITTKYDIGDKVWVLEGNKVWEREIAGIVINKGTMYNTKEGKCYTSNKELYYLKNFGDSYCHTGLFQTKEELLKSL